MKLHKMIGILILTAIGCCLMAGCSVSVVDEFSAGRNSIIINEGTEWKLAGVLTLPEGDEPFPLVVILHSSGHSCKNGTYSIFLDLADDLAKEGIASIRFDKRTHAYYSIMQDVNLTPREEYLDDLFSAIDLAKTINYINSEMIYVAGWGMGGFLIPKVDEEDKEDMIAGYISLAGSADTELTIANQLVSYYETALLDPEISADEKEMAEIVLESYQIKAQKLANLTEADEGSSAKIGDYYMSYWLWLKDYNPTESVKNVNKPILFLQGDGDKLVPPSQLDVWREATKDNPQVVTKLYSNLGHSFFKIGGEARILGEVAVDIADFIKNQR